MSKETLKNILAGGVGTGAGPGSLAAILTELQGLTLTYPTGAAANTKIDVADLRTEDTILMALQIANTGGAADRTANITVVDLHATGTLTLTSAIATDAVTVNGKTYTFQVGIPVKYGEVQIGGSDTLSAAALATAINMYETSLEHGNADVVATSAAGVVTITAIEEGTSGNAIAISSADATIVASGATLAGGSATGGFKCSIDTTGSGVLLVYLNKK